MRLAYSVIPFAPMLDEAEDAPRVARLEALVTSASLDRSFRTWSLVGGWSLVAATVLFVAEFSYLSSTFDYPMILDRPASEVLPRLVSLGWAGRGVWIIYGLTPLLLIPASHGVAAASRDGAPHASRAAVVVATLSAVFMVAGLLRWPSLHWHLALAYGSGTAAARESIDAIFAAANSYLGTFTGEFLGELFLNAFFAFASFALVRSGAASRWVLYTGAAVSLIGAVAMLRNVTTLVAPIAAVNNAVLPLWLLVLGVVLLRARPR